MKHSHRIAALSAALAAVFAIPFAAAQSLGVGVGTQAEVKTATPAATVQAQTRTDAAAQAATPAVPATPATPATPEKKSWSQLDLDGSGTLSASEAAALQSLGKVFAEADANADGQLTAEEYKAHLAARGQARGEAGTKEQ